MEARELRIGNWVDVDGGIGKVKTIDPNGDIWENFGGVVSNNDDSVWCRIGMGDKCKPIPLTEEWLLKFGFKFNLCSKYWGDRFCIHLKDNEFYVLYESGRVWIESVHQLQNIYFALTGQELELKPI